MFKSFQNFNSWWQNNVPNEISTTLNRAMSRVTALFRQLSTVVQDYTSAYNSVQTLGYDDQGEIQDQTSADRITVPDNIISRTINALNTQYKALINDRIAFIQDFKPAQSIYGLELVKNSAIEDVTDVDRVLSLGGYGSLVYRQDGYAQLYIERATLELLGRSDPSGIYNDAYLLPQVAFKDSVASDKYYVTVYSSEAHFPRLLPTVSDLKWRLIAVGNPNNPIRPYICLDLYLDGQYRFFFFSMEYDNIGYISEFKQAESDEFPFADWNSFKTFLSDKGITPPDGTLVYGLTWGPSGSQAIGWSSMSPDMQQMALAYFTPILANYNGDVVRTRSLPDVAKLTFNTVTSLTPESLLSVIETLQ